MQCNYIKQEYILLVFNFKRNNMENNNLDFSDFDEQYHQELQGMKVLNLDSLRQEALERDVSEPLPSFKEITFEAKYGQENMCGVCEDKFYKGRANFQKLMDDIKKNKSNDSFFFFYGNYTKDLPKIKMSDLSSNLFELNKGYDFQPKNAFDDIEFETSVLFSYLDNRTGKEVMADLQVYLNQRACYIDIKKYGFRFKFDYENNQAIYYLEFIYSDSLDKRNFDKIRNYTIEDKYIAISIETKNINDFLALAKYLNLPNFENEIQHFFIDKLTNTKDVDKLGFLYNNLPSDYSFLKKISTIGSISILEHIDILLKYDTTGFLGYFRDETGTLIKVLTLLCNSVNNLSDYLFNNFYIKQIYENLKGKSIVEGVEKSNKVLFTDLLNAMIIDQMSKNKKLPDDIRHIDKTFYYGKNYKIDSDISIVSDEEEDEFFLKQIRYIQKTKPYKVDGDSSGTAMRGTETVGEWDKSDSGAMYKPLDLVTLVIYIGGKDFPITVPAIYVKALAEEAEWVEVDKAIRIGFDMLAVILGVVALTTTANPGLLALAIADLGISGGDIIVQTLGETVLGKEFLETWEQIYMVGGIAIAIVSAPHLIQSFYRLGNSILKTASAATLKEMRKFYLKAFLEINISNFTGNTVKAVEPNTIFFGAEYRAMAQEMEKCGVLFVSGQKEGKMIEHYAAVYKGEVIEEFTKATKDKFAAKYWKSKGYQLLNKLDEIADTIKYENGRVGYVEGLYDSIDVNYNPYGFNVLDSTILHPNYGKGIISQFEGYKGLFYRNFDDKKRIFTFNAGFSDDLPRWVEDVKVPLLQGKGIPTQAYFTLRQMKLLQIPDGAIEIVRMSTIQNLDTAAYIHQVTNGKIIRNFETIDILSSSSNEYMKTVMTQSGYKTISGKIIGEGQYLSVNELKELGYTLNPKFNNSYEAFMKEYGLSLDSKLYVNYNIEVKVKYIK